ncbi:MAG: hypothetical protein KAW87_04380 [Candidatus Cloacimonetes bacterium]|nr:hypothetical protein [Candidatus Cloacimonadota bacterium]
MKLKRSEKVILIASFGAVALSAIVHIAIREWYKPDVRYEECPYYIFGEIAVVSLRINNWGHSDAEETTMTTRFPAPLKAISLDRSNVTYSVLSGGFGKHNVTIRLSDLVPSQEVFVFYSIEYSSNDPIELPSSFVKEITFKGGRGRIGKPAWLYMFIMVVMAIVQVYFIISSIIYIYRRKSRS